MDASTVEIIVAENIEGMARAVGVPHWKIAIDYAPLPDGVQAQCDLSRAEYWQADITIDPAKAESRQGILHSLRHELLHVVAAPFHHYRRVVTAALDFDSDEGYREHELWKYAVEQHVVALERGLASGILEGL